MNFEKRGNGFSIQNPEERFLVDMLSQVTGRLKEKYNYSEEEIFQLWNNELLVPIQIFSGNLSPAEALAKFLKESHGLSYAEIAKLVGRDQRSIWANYKRAAKKMPWPLQVDNNVSAPVSIFNSDKSILEALVSHLRDARSMSNAKIAHLLNKNPASTWTAYSRAKKKNNGNKNEN